MTLSLAASGCVEVSGSTGAAVAMHRSNGVARWPDVSVRRVGTEVPKYRSTEVCGRESLRLAPWATNEARSPEPASADPGQRSLAASTMPISAGNSDLGVAELRFGEGTDDGLGHRLELEHDDLVAAGTRHRRRHEHRAL